MNNLKNEEKSETRDKDENETTEIKINEHLIIKKLNLSYRNNFHRITNTHNNIQEFSVMSPHQFQKRMKSSDRDMFSIALIGIWNQVDIGYVTAYDRYSDGSLYCWMAGVKSEKRGCGVLTALMQALEEQARQNGFNSLRIRTRNQWRAMLSYLVNHNYIFESVEHKGTSDQCRINLFKNL